MWRRLMANPQRIPAVVSSAAAGLSASLPLHCSSDWEVVEPTPSQTKPNRSSDQTKSLNENSGRKEVVPTSNACWELLCEPQPSFAQSPVRVSFRTAPIDLHEAQRVLPFALSQTTFLEVPQSDGLLYKYLLDHAAMEAEQVHSLRLTWSYERPSAGLGWVVFKSECDLEDIWMVHQTVCSNAAGMGSPQLYHSIVLAAGGSSARQRLETFCKEVVESHKEKSDPSRIVLWRFDHGDKSWRRLASRPVRPWDSVILPEDLRHSLEEDLDWFCDEATELRYGELGVPYRRVYLFSGPPGAGKTSLAAAVAGRTRRQLCILPIDERLDGDTMMLAIQRAPSHPLIVIEDAELWLRRGDVSDLLNALDGLATAQGALFVMTSNNPEPLAEAHYGALLRPGRLDLHLRFKPCDKALVQGLFGRFFPNADSDALQALDTPKVVGASMAEIQHILLACDRRKLSAQACAQSVASIMREGKSAVGL